MKMTTEPRKMEDGWWFTINGEDTGPYDTKKEAEEALRGLQKFYKAHPEVKDDNYVSPKEPGANKMDATTTTTKKAASVKKSKRAEKTSKPPVEKKPAVKKTADNPFASKLDGTAGIKIEKLFLDGKSWKEIASEMGVSISSVRFRFLDYLIKQSYDLTEQ